MISRNKDDCIGRKTRRSATGRLSAKLRAVQVLCATVRAARTSQIGFNAFHGFDLAQTLAQRQTQISRYDVNSLYLTE
jgi:hypothetical protein